MAMKKVLTIAGSDASGGAGLEADLKTMQEFGVYGMAAVTCIVSMDPHDNWSHHVSLIDIDRIKDQLITIVEGVGVDAMKTGMLSNPEITKLAADTIKKYNLPNVVIDPVMVCKGADEVLYPDHANAIRDFLTPVAKVITPNLYEAAHISGLGVITTVEKMKDAAKAIHELGAEYVLIKGGNKLEHKYAVDVLYDGKEFDILEGERIVTTYTHGAGCTYSSAIASELANGKTVKEAVYSAKEFITAAIRHSFPLNQFVGPVCHAASRLYE